MKGKLLAALLIVAIALGFLLTPNVAQAKRVRICLQTYPVQCYNVHIRK